MVYTFVYIYWIFVSAYSMNLAIDAVINGRDSLTKMLYNCIFEKIIVLLNGAITFDSSSKMIGILDIPGFGKIQIYTQHTP